MNSGIEFERRIWKKLQILNRKEIGFWQKSPTPISPLISSINNKPFIKNAIFNRKAIGDFFGIYKGNYFLLECKQTKLKSFALKNIKQHQIVTMNKIKKQNGNVWLIIEFTFYQKIIIINFIDYKDLLKLLNKKSVSIWQLSIFGYLINETEFYNLFVKIIRNI